MALATITSKHQVTIPKEVRERMNLVEGDQVEFSPDPSGKFVLRKRETVHRSDGAAARLMKPKKRMTLEQMKAAAAKGARDAYQRRSK